MAAASRLRRRPGRLRPPRSRSEKLKALAEERHHGNVSALITERTEEAVRQAAFERAWRWFGGAEPSDATRGWDRLDNGGIASADRIVPALQRLAVGDVLPIKASGPDGFAVLALDAPRALVLGDPSLLAGRPRPPEGAPRATWAFCLEPRGDAATRLFVRVRVAYAPSLTAALLAPIVLFAHEIMERKQLRTLRQRAEARGGAP